MRLLWCFHGTVTEPPWDYHGTCMRYLNHESLMTLPWCSHATFMGRPWHSHGTSEAALPWTSHGAFERYTECAHHLLYRHRPLAKAPLYRDLATSSTVPKRMSQQFNRIRMWSNSLAKSFARSVSHSPVFQASPGRRPHCIGGVLTILSKIHRGMNGAKAGSSYP